MSLDDAVAVLRDVPLFRNVDPNRLRVVAMMGETLSYFEGERLFEAGDEGDCVFVILSGSVDVLAPVETGEKAVAQLGQGEIVGEMAVLTDGPRTTAIAAAADLQVLRLDRATILNLLSEFPDIALQVIRVLARRLDATTRRLAEGVG